NDFNGRDGGVAVVDAADNTMGGTTPEARNVISGNLGDGLEIGGSGAVRNRVQGNFIGLNKDGDKAIPNAHNGVHLGDFPGVVGSPSHNTIGGSRVLSNVAAGNVISGNVESGVKIDAGASDNLVQGNLIGTTASGLAPRGN